MKRAYRSEDNNVTVWSMVRPGGRYGALVEVLPDAIGDDLVEQPVEGSFRTSREALAAGLEWAEANYPADAGAV